MVEKTLARYEARPNAYVRRLQQNYGPEGMVLLIAARAGQLYGSAIGVIGGLLLIVSRASGSVAIAGYALLGLAFMIAVVIMFRSIQGGAAGKRFRNGRPFIRR